MMTSAGRVTPDVAGSSPVAAVSQRETNRCITRLFLDLPQGSLRHRASTKVGARRKTVTKSHAPGQPQGTQLGERTGLENGYGRFGASEVRIPPLRQHIAAGCATRRGGVALYATGSGVEASGGFAPHDGAWRVDLTRPRSAPGWRRSYSEMAKLTSVSVRTVKRQVPRCLTSGLSPKPVKPAAPAR
jgi:hypothetical protein